MKGDKAILIGETRLVNKFGKVDYQALYRVAGRIYRIVIIMHNFGSFGSSTFQSFCVDVNSGTTLWNNEFNMQKTEEDDNDQKAEDKLDREILVYTTILDRMESLKGCA